MKRRLRRIAAVVVPILIAVALPILFSRCTPQWLPDSSGFIYIATTGEVKAYDLKTGKSRQLTKLKFPVAGLAVWPSGDRVCVARFRQGDKAAMQIATYDLRGNEKHVSPWHPLKEGTTKEGFYMVDSHVSPDGKHVVTFVPSLQTAIIYDVERRTFRNVKNAASLSLLGGAIGEATGREQMPWFHNVSAATPDGKGFIAMRQIQGGDDIHFALFPWGAGEPRKIPLPDEQKKALLQAEKEKQIRVATVPQWKGGVLSMQLRDLTLRIDPAMRVASLKKDMQSDHLYQHAEKHGVRVLHQFAGSALLQAKANDLQLWRRGGATVSVGSLAKGQILSLAPSPDGRRILVRAMGEKDHLRVIDETGRILAEIGQPLRQ